MIRRAHRIAGGVMDIHRSLLELLEVRQGRYGLREEGSHSPLYAAPQLEALLTAGFAETKQRRS